MEQEQHAKKLSVTTICTVSTDAVVSKTAQNSFMAVAGHEVWYFITACTVGSEIGWRFPTCIGQMPHLRPKASAHI
jgi:hypothetical protein